MRASHQLTINALSNLLGAAAGLIAGLVLPPFVIGEIGRESYGTVIILASALQFIGLVQLGTPRALNRFVATEIALEDREALSGVLSTGLPILNAIRISDEERKIDVTSEVALHVGDNVVRCIAMSSTDGLMRGMDAVDLGRSISVPVGEQALGRVFSLLGDPIDGKGPVPNPDKRYNIHRQSPSLEDQATEAAQLETGIKVVDMLAPYPKGRQGWPFRRRWCGQDGAHPGVDS